jgi:anti-anti-sigma regulatory factor
MKSTSHSSPSAPVQLSHIATVDLDAVDAVHLARVLASYAQKPSLLIDCSTLTCLRTLGVSHVVSQLLVLHRAGAQIWLVNVKAPLRYCLQLLQLSKLFHVDASY